MNTEIAKKMAEHAQIDAQAMHKGESVKDIFCRYEPSLSEGLQILYSALTNPIAKFCVSIVQHIADRAKETFCPPAGSK